MTNDGGHGLIPILQTVVYRVWLAHCVWLAQLNGGRLTVIISDSGSGSVCRSNHNITPGSGHQQGSEHLCTFKCIIIHHSNIHNLHSFIRCKGHHSIGLPSEVIRICGNYQLRCDCNITIGPRSLQNVLPVAVPGEVLKSTETGCMVMVRFTIRNITTAPSDSVTVYMVGTNSITTTARIWKCCLSEC